MCIRWQARRAQNSRCGRNSVPDRRPGPRDLSRRPGVAERADVQGVVTTASATYLSETDPKVGTLTALKWCATNAGGTAIDCTLDAPLRTANDLSDLASASTARTNLGLGSIATQAAGAVAITGGTIDGTAIGGTTPAAGAFTTISASGAVTFATTLNVTGVITGVGSGLTTLNASNLSSGTVATARLGTGTANTTTFLRGDGSWTAPTGGTLAGLTDVSLASPASSEILSYNGSAWTNAAVGSLVAGVAGPSFSVHKNGTNQTVTAYATNILTWSTETFDTNNNFASNKFTPTVAGKYLVTLSVYCSNASTYCEPGIRKNGGVVAYGLIYTDSTETLANATIILEMNGSTDYVDAIVIPGDGTNISGNSSTTYFTGSMMAPLASGVVAGTGSAGYVPYWTSGNALTYDSTAGGQFYWDSTNHRLGIGMTAPSNTLGLTGTAPSMGITNSTTGRSTAVGLGSGYAYFYTTGADDVVIGANGLNNNIRINSTIGNVGIGTATPATTALVDMYSTTKGLLPPRMTTTQRDAISSPATGLVVYNTTTNALNVYGASSWGVVGAGSITADSLDFTDFADAMTLDASTDIGIGTTSAYTLSITNTGTGNSFLVNDAVSDTSPFVIAADGKVGIGTTSPSELLNLHNPSAVSTTFIGLGVGGSPNNVATLAYNGSTTALDLTLVGRPLSITGGNVGIDTASPTVSQSGGALHIAGANAGLRLGLTADGGWGYLEFADETPTVKFIQGYRDTDASYRILAGTSLGNTTGIILGSTGNVGIGATPFTSAQSSMQGTGGYSLFFGTDYPGLGLSNYPITTASNTAPVVTVPTGHAGVPAAISVNQNDGAVKFWSANYTAAEATATLTEKMRITAAGNVGIGTASPLAELHVASPGDTDLILQRTDATGATGSIYFSGTVGAAQGYGAKIKSYGNDLEFYTDAAQNDAVDDLTQRMTIAGDGNVGIGTASPGFKFEVKTGGYNDGIHLKDSTGTVYGGLFVESGVFAVRARSNHPMLLATSDTERMRIDSSGNVGIGNTSPQTTLSVGDYSSGTGEATYKGAIQIQDPNASASLNGNTGLEFKGSPSGNGYGWKIGTVTPAAVDLAFGYRQNSASWSEAMRINSSGNVGIGTTAPASTALLDVYSSTKGFLPPRMTTTQRDAVSSPAEGLTIYDTTTDALNIYTGSAWAAVGSGTDLDSLSDVTITSATNADILQYDGSAWVNTPLVSSVAGAAGPSFSVHKNGTNQTVTANSYTKITWSTETFDTNNNFASDRFTPTVAGKRLHLCLSALQ